MAVAEQHALGAWLVDASELPRLRQTSKTLSLEDVVAEAYLPDLAETLNASGFRGGVQHEFRGRSRQLTGVESQALAFLTPAGAADFGQYVADHASAFFGSPTKVTPLTMGGYAGWLFDPPVCACAGAQPLSAGALQVGDKLLVLQITGPEADARTLRGLLRAVST